MDISIIQENELMNTHMMVDPQNKHFCAHCFEVSHLNRCSGCKLVYYCSRECQKADWTYHSTLCKNVELQHQWKSSIQEILFEIGDQSSKSKPSSSERMEAIHNLQLLEYWSKRCLVSTGYLESLLKQVINENSQVEINETNETIQKYNYSLVALVDALRSPDDKSIDEEMCLSFVYDLNGLEYLLTSLKRPNLNAEQRISSLRFFRLLCCNTQTQDLVVDKMDSLIIKIQDIIEISQSGQVVSEFGFALSSLIYSLRGEKLHDHEVLYQTRQLIGTHLGLRTIIECALGQSSLSRSHVVEIGAVELLLALLDGNPLTKPVSPSDEWKLGSFVNDFLLNDISLLRDLVYGLFDLLVIPAEQIFGAAIFGIASLFSHPQVVNISIQQNWMISELEDNQDENQGQTNDIQPLQCLLSFVIKPPMIQLSHFDTNIHHNILSVLYNVISSPFCSKGFLEAAIGTNFLALRMEYLERNYKQEIEKAEHHYQNQMSNMPKKSQVSQLMLKQQIGNQIQLEAILSMIQEVNKKASKLKDDVLLTTI